MVYEKDHLDLSKQNVYASKVSFSAKVHRNLVPKKTVKGILIRLSELLEEDPI